MAAEMLPSPGTDGGPCAYPHCGHQDCELVRAMAQTLCRLCSIEIGYDRRFHSEDGPPGIQDRRLRAILVHGFCLEREIERERVAQLAREQRGGGDDGL